MRPKTIILMVIAVGCGLAASLFANRLIGAKNNQPQQVEQELFPVLVARTNIGQYTALKDEKMFVEERRPRSEIMKGTIGNWEKAKGRVVKVALKQGEALVDSDLRAVGESDILDKLKPGERAVTVKVTSITGTGGFIQVGYKVDVVATVTRMRNQEEPYSKTILQDIEVLAINTKLQAEDGQPNQQADHVTLRVALQDAETLGLYSEIGTLRLLPRRPEDPTIQSTSGVTAKGAKQANPNEVHAVPSPAPAVPTNITAPSVPELTTPVKADPEKFIMKIYQGNQPTRTVEFIKEESEKKDEKKDKEEKK